MYVVTPDIEQAYTVSLAIHVHESCIHVSGEGSALKCIHLISDLLTNVYIIKYCNSTVTVDSEMYVLDLWFSMHMIYKGH